MTQSLFRSKTAYKVYSILGMILVLFGVNQELVRRAENNGKFQVKERDDIIERMTEQLDKANNQLQTLDEFLAQTNVRQTLKENDKKKQTIAQLEKKNNDLLQLNENLVKKQNEYDQDKNILIEKWNGKLKAHEIAYQNKMKQMQGVLYKKDLDIRELKQQPLVDLSQVYHVEDLDISDLVIRLRFLQYLCDRFPGSMDAKNSSYKILLNDLKRAAPNDSYIRKIKPVKFYTDTPMWASLKEKYSKNDEGNLDQYLQASNRRMYEQLKYILDYINVTYG